MLQNYFVYISLDLYLFLLVMLPKMMEMVKGLYFFQQTDNETDLLNLLLMMMMLLILGNKKEEEGWGHCCPYYHSHALPVLILVEVDEDFVVCYHYLIDLLYHSYHKEYFSHHH
jgi:hypothetical protein